MYSSLALSTLIAVQLSPLSPESSLSLHYYWLPEPQAQSHSRTQAASSIKAVSNILKTSIMC